MELNNLFIRHRLHDCHLFCLAILSWLLLFFWIQPPAWLTESGHWPLLIVSGLAALIILKLFENIGAFCIVQRQSDAFFMSAAFIAGTAAGDLTLSFFTERSSQSQGALVTGLILGIVTIACFAFAIRFLISYERKRKVALYITNQQRDLLLKELAPSGLEKCMQLLTGVELKQHLLRGDLSKIDMIVISRETVRHFDSEAILLRAHLAGVPIIDFRELCCKIGGRIDITETDLSSYLLGATKKTLLNRIMLRTKYFLEPLAALILAVVFAPVFLAVIIAITFLSPGPVFYLQSRTGYMGKPFKLVKFRSMRVDAEADGPRWCARNDPRVTPLGHFLRRTRLDELPQLWNVIRGEMSFVGPRPERPEIYKQLEDDVPLFSLRTLVRPGITGWAQVSAGYAASSAESLLKLEHDLFYIQHMTLRFDLYILLKTVKIAVLGDEKFRKKVRLLPRSTPLVRTAQSHF